VTVNARALDLVSLEVLHNRLEAIVEQMGVTMLKAAHSPIFYESKDYSVALFTPAGELLAMGQYIPHHQGGMYAALAAVRELHPPDEMSDGDVYLINDSYMGGTHTADFNVFTPIFAERRLVGFAGCVAHQMDVGGMNPGGYCPVATDIYQEGVRFPAIKLAENGRLRDDVMRTIMRNVRLPEQQRGDLLGQLAALRVAARAVPRAVERYGADAFVGLCSDLIDLTERRVRAELAALPDGSYIATDVIDHDGIENRLFPLKVTLTITGDELTADFTGTSPQAKGFINASESNTRAATLAALMLFLDPEIPRNHGFFRPLTVEIPEGTLLNPRYPAPVGASTTECGGRVYDLVLQALGQAAPTSGFGTWSMCWLGISFVGTNPRSGETFIHWVLDGLGTGGGGRPNADGWNASSIAASNCLIPNVELEEEAYPVRYRRRELWTDSGGVGKYRGGLGLETELEVETECRMTVLGSRGKTAPPPGAFGGGPGGAAGVWIRREDLMQEVPMKATGIDLSPGDRIIMRAPGGGGYGDPAERDPALIASDLRQGFVSPAAATPSKEA
jgi:N-methylhydantoinase B